MDSIRKIAIGGGPLKGTTVEVHVNAETFTTPAGDGHYEVTEAGARWHGRKPAEPEPSTKPARKPARKTAAKPQVPAPADAPVEQPASKAE